MSKSPVREDKTCLNCHHVVQFRYCPNCGQENTETRKTFHHLFIHFFEDLTHYENAFWKTIRNLLFKPGSLTKVYLSGKRMSYLAPIRLYIFISFVTFFVLSMLPNSTFDDNIKIVDEPKKGFRYSINDPMKSAAELPDTVTVDSIMIREDKSYGDEIFEMTEKELDSLQRSAIEDDRMPNWLYKRFKRAFYIQKHNTKAEIRQKFTDALWRNIPKALFIYMPMFAFVLWLFQSKRRWYYFDHGIFTLHYFSFLLLIYLIVGLTSTFFGLFTHWFTRVLNGLVTLTLFGYAFYYFFPAHHGFYQETRLATIIKGGLIFVINMFLATLLIIALMTYSFLNIQ